MFLDFWLYGVLRAASDLGNAKVFLRKAEEAAIRKLIDTVGIGPWPDRDPATVLRGYLGTLDERGLTEAADVVIQPQGDGLRLEIGARCPCRSACEWAHEEGRPAVCFRAVAFSEALRQLGKRDFKSTLESFGLPCVVTMAPGRIEVR